MRKWKKGVYLIKKIKYEDIMGIIIYILISVVKKAIGVGSSKKGMLKIEQNKNTKEFFYGQYFFMMNGFI